MQHFGNFTNFTNKFQLSLKLVFCFCQMVWFDLWRMCETQVELFIDLLERVLRLCVQWELWFPVFLQLCTQWCGNVRMWCSTLHPFNTLKLQRADGIWPRNTSRNLFLHFHLGSHNMSESMLYSSRNAQFINKFINLKPPILQHIIICWMSDCPWHC